MTENVKTTIIAVMPHGPAYDYHPGERPEHCWELPGGGMAGFWANEWMDVLGAEIIKHTDRYSWEVWQPDLRADKIYSKQLGTGVTHRLFPAKERRYGRWPLGEQGLWSEELFAALKALDGRREIAMIYGTWGFRLPFYNWALEALAEAKSVPVFLRSGGMFRAPLKELPGFHHPLTYLRLLRDHFRMRRLLCRADIVSEQSADGLAQLRSVYGGRVEKVTMGCDFSFWKPAPSQEAKAAARDALGVKPGQKLFFASGNFVGRKRLSSLAGAFRALGAREDFFLLIAGQGEPGPTEELRALLKPLADSGRALLHPYATGEGLLRLYQAADYYVSVATDEGGPASVMKAMACGLPVFATRVGATADTLAERGAGRLLEVDDFHGWARAFAEALDGNVPRPLGLADAAAEYDWPNATDRFVRIFDGLRARRGEGL